MGKVMGRTSNQRFWLLLDAVINLLLGLLLLRFPPALVALLGIPTAESSFYPSILGAILFGIGVSLLLERSRGGGLALAGAVSINLCGGAVLALWLLFGRLQLPYRGYALLWGLVAILVGISAFEILARYRQRQIG